MLIPKQIWHLPCCLVVYRLSVLIHFVSSRYSERSLLFILPQYFFHLLRLAFPPTFTPDIFSAVISFFLSVVSPFDVSRPRLSCERATAHSFTHSAGVHSFIHSFNTFVPRGDTGLLSPDASRLGTSLTVLCNVIGLNTCFDFSTYA